MQIEHTTAIDNGIYDHWGEHWYTGQDHVGLLRAQSAPLTAWVIGEVTGRLASGRVRVLDLGCGAGFMANRLAEHGFEVTGVDASEQSLSVAARHDTTGRVRYLRGDVRQLPVADAAFDAVTAMDLLEHVEEPELVIAEAARVLAPGGLFLFHTFNRNPLAWLLIIKGVEWFVRGTPPRLHVLRLFVKPDEAKRACGRHGLAMDPARGFGPDVLSTAFWRMLLHGSVPPELTFSLHGSTLTSYVAVAEKQARG
jgi:2-polyprenyl-6-hydroxyphenyl methylase/3-demethylubiquinone-9 3-methyltransferase